MQAQYKTYDSYKDSGTEWLGQIPSSWNTLRIKHVLKEVSEKGYPNEQLLSATQDEGVVPRDSREQRVVMPIGALQTFKLVQNDDFVISLRSFQGGIEHSAYRGLVSPAYTVLRRTRDIEAGFLKYLMKSSLFISELNVSVTGIRQGKNIDFKELSYSLIPIPSKSEQERIVAFLDQKTAEIDAAIEKKQRLIELLKEQKSILINQAVTKGLNPSAPMKDSGIELVGQIPAHWEVKRLKNICHIYGRIGFRGYTASDLVDEGQGAITLSPSNIHESGFSTDKVSYLSWNKYNESPEIMIFEDDIIFVKTGSSYGKSALIDHYPMEMTINPQLVVLKKIKMLPSLLQLNLSAEYFQQQIRTTVIGGTIPTIGQAAIGALSLIVPSANDALELNHYCKSVADDFSPAFLNALKEIEKLQEFKQTLIAHAVTGKIKI